MKRAAQRRSSSFTSIDKKTGDGQGARFRGASRAEGWLHTGCPHLSDANTSGLAQRRRVSPQAARGGADHRKRGVLPGQTGGPAKATVPKTGSEPPTACTKGEGQIKRASLTVCRIAGEILAAELWPAGAPRRPETAATRKPPLPKPPCTGRRGRLPGQRPFASADPIIGIFLTRKDEPAVRAHELAFRSAGEKSAGIGSFSTPFQQTIKKPGCMGQLGFSIFTHVRPKAPVR